MDQILKKSPIYLIKGTFFLQFNQANMSIVDFHVLDFKNIVCLLKN